MALFAHQSIIRTINNAISEIHQTVISANGRTDSEIVNHLEDELICIEHDIIDSIETIDDLLQNTSLDIKQICSLNHTKAQLIERKAIVSEYLLCMVKLA